MPYITASIIIQLLVVVIPPIRPVEEEGQARSAELTQYSRYLTVGLAILQSTGFIRIGEVGSAVPGLRGRQGNPLSVLYEGRHLDPLNDGHLHDGWHPASSCGWAS